MLVKDYFTMLKAELREQPFNKAEHLRSLKPQLNNRSDRAIEDKHQNVSAVLHELRCPSIDGYKPLPNYQKSLFPVVASHYRADAELQEILERIATRPVSAPAASDILARRVEPPTYKAPRKMSPDRSFAIELRVDWFKRDAERRELGAMGELFVVAHERARLRQAGRETLADRVTHSSVEEGDGLGFDIRSFEDDGTDRFIEVKTTSYSRDTPFYVSRNELMASQKLTVYRLYRVFQFYRGPRFFDLKGDLGQACVLEPHMYSARAK